MMKEIRWGIIGCGDVTEIKSGPAFSKVPQSKLVAVMRRNAAKAEDYAARHDVPKWYSDAEKLINDEEINAIYIATPPLQHEAYTLAALQAGKPVYVEKPMTLNAASALRLKVAADEANLPLVVAHYRREQPLFKKIKQLLDQNEIGIVRLINLQLLQPPASPLIAQTDENWRLNPAISGGGLFHDLAPHQLDMMIHFFGEPSSAKGFSLKQQSSSPVDDCVGGVVQFAKNILFTGHWCFTTDPEQANDYCEIIGSEGRISFRFFQPANVLVYKDGKVDEWEFEKLEHVQQPMIEKVVAHFLGHAPNPCPASAGVSVMQLMDEFTRK